MDAYYEMRNGLVVMQAEDGEFVFSNNSHNNNWEETTRFNGEDGTVMLWDGDDFFGTRGADLAGERETAPIEYRFEIDQPGTYYISLRAIRPNTGEEADRNNDFFVQFEDEGYEKLFFSGNTARNQFQWATKFDLHGSRPPSTFDVTQSMINKNDGVFSLFVAGRSHAAGIDEIHINRGAFSRDASAPTSRLITDGNSSSDDTPPAPADNDAPNARNDAAATDHDTTVTVDVLDNDTDPDGDDLTITDIDYDGNTARVSIVNGGIQVNPLSSATNERVEQISYTIEDEFGETDTATLSVTVAAASDDTSNDGDEGDDTPPPPPASSDNDDPTATNDSKSTDFDTTVRVAVLGNDSDPDGDDLTIASISYTGDTALVSLDGDIIVVNPLRRATEARIEEVSYTISDGNGGTDTGVLRVNVGGAQTNDDDDNDDDDTPPPSSDDGPVAVDDIVGTAQNRTIVVDVLANDDAGDNGPLTLVDFDYGGSTSIVSIEAGQIEVNPLRRATFDRVEEITYTVADANGEESTATLKVNVGAGAADDAPTPGADAALTFFLADASTDEVIQEIRDGDQIDTDNLPDNLTLLATADDPDSFRFVSLSFDGITKREAVEPYALFGDSNGDLFGGFEAETGTFEAVARGYDIDNDLIAELELTFEFV